MADAQRISPDYNVQHHAVTPLWSDKSKAWLAQWFSDNGFARGYASNPNNWNGLINPFTGQRSYAQAHAVGQRVDSTTPDATDAERAAGYRVFWIVADPWGVITYGAGNWDINRRAINTENLGDYRNYPLRDGDIRVIADFWRARDKQLNGNTAVVGHLEVTQTSTACPSRIMEGRDLIVHYINNPPNTNPPAPQPEPVKEVSRDVFDPLKKFRFNKDSRLYDLLKYTVAKDSRVYTQGEEIDIKQRLTLSNGNVWYRTKYSSDNELGTGFRAEDLEEIKAPVITTNDETRTEAVPFETETYKDDRLPVGETRVVDEGIDGIRTIITTITYQDGIEVSRAEKSNQITTAPVNRKVTEGTLEPVTPDPDPQPKPPTGFFGFIKWLLQQLIGAFKKEK